MPSRIATQTMSTTTLAAAVSHQPSVASLRPAAPVASMYDDVPLHAASMSATAGATARIFHQRTRRCAHSVHIVAPLQRAERRRVDVVAEVALPSAIGEPGGIRSTLRLDVRHHLPDLLG